MDKLTRINSIILRWVLFAGITYCLTASLDNVVHGYRYFESLNAHSSDSDFYSSWQNLCLAVITGFIGWKYVYSKTRQKDRFHNNWFALKKLMPAFSSFEKPIILISASVLCLTSLVLLEQSFQSMVRPLASLADYCQNYELAERIYVLYGRRTPNQTFASSQSCFVLEPQNVLYGRNAAVANIYGQSSPELIERFLHVACNIDYGSGNTQLEEAIYWLERGLALTDPLRNTDRALSALEHIALLRYEVNDFDRVKLTLNGAVERLNEVKHGAQLPTKKWLISELLWYAKKVGDPSSEKILSSWDKRLRLTFTGESEWSRFINKLPYTVFLFSLVLIVAPTSRILGYIPVSLMYRKSLKRFKKESDTAIKLHQLDRMMQFESYRKDFKKAWEHSLDALNLVGIETDEASRHIDEDILRSVKRKITLSNVCTTGFAFILLIFFWK